MHQSSLNEKEFTGGKTIPGNIYQQEKKHIFLKIRMRIPPQIMLPDFLKTRTNSA
jgi:hypothetical protein